MKSGLYAGSFDPWSKGHQFVLNAALNIFDRVHILVAINPAKHGTMETKIRAQSIAHSINPFVLWEKENPPYNVNENVLISYTTGLVVSYAQEHGIKYLVRGLRSTSDFEAEFGLYFSNLAIDHSMQTWCVLCPPDLLHCSSTFIRNVVGMQGIDFVGTSFLTQAQLLKQKTNLAHLLDLIHYCSLNLGPSIPAMNVEPNGLKALQKLFVHLYANKVLACPNAEATAENFILNFITGYKQNNEKNKYFSSAELRWLCLAVISVLERNNYFGLVYDAIENLNKISNNFYSPDAVTQL